MPILFDNNSLFETPEEALHETEGHLQHEASKFNLIRSRSLWLNIGRHNSDPNLIRRARQDVKDYAGLPFFPLSVTQPDQDFYEVLTSRTKTPLDQLSNSPIELSSIARVLHFSYGRRPSSPYRNAPSGGARYGAEIYLVAHDIVGLDPGLYYYDSPRSGLFLIREGALRTDWSHCLGDQFQAEAGACSLVVTSCYRRSTEKYWARGWRLAYLDGGHLCQNLWLTATAEGLAVSPEFSCLDDRLASFLNLGHDEIFLNSFRLGRGLP